MSPNPHFGFRCTRMLASCSVKVNSWRNLGLPKCSRQTFLPLRAEYKVSHNDHMMITWWSHDDHMMVTRPPHLIVPKRHQSLMHSSCHQDHISPNCYSICARFMSLSFRSAMFHVLYCMCNIYSMSMMSGSVIVLFCTCQIYGTERQIDTTRLQLMWGSLTLTQILSERHETWLCIRIRWL